MLSTNKEAKSDFVISAKQEVQSSVFVRKLGQEESQTFAIGQILFHNTDSFV
jgi:hypothetical protein